MLIFLSSCATFTAKEPAEFWIDVRSAEEYSEGHYKESINIPHSSIAERIEEITTDKNATIHVYCRSGRRAGMAKDALEALGFKQVINHGGLDDVLEDTKTEAEK